MATSHADRYDPTEPAQASRAGLLLSAGLLLAGVLLTVLHSRLTLGLAAIGVGGTGLAIEALVRADRPVTKRQATITMGVAITASWIAISWGPWYGR